MLRWKRLLIMNLTELLILLKTRCFVVNAMVIRVIRVDRRILLVTVRLRRRRRVGWNWNLFTCRKWMRMRLVKVRRCALVKSLVRITCVFMTRKRRLRVVFTRMCCNVTVLLYTLMVRLNRYKWENRVLTNVLNNVFVLHVLMTRLNPLIVHLMIGLLIVSRLMP